MGGSGRFWHPANNYHAGVVLAMARLFEPFSQADVSIERSRGGLGLGLAIVRGISELHGGRAWVESPGLGQGATFRVWLPLADSTCIAEGCQTVAARPVTQQRVLIIDDQADAAVALRKLLQRAGHLVSIASDGQMGLDNARQFQPQVVLCDIGLPGGMNGYEVAAEFRRDSGLQSAYLVAVTGYGQEEDRRDAQAAGFDYHVTKPVSNDQLQQILADRPCFAG